jgi:four helix bundle protein
MSGEWRVASVHVRSYRDLLVWQKGVALAKLVYKLTGGFPASERFGLVAQLRRAAISVPSNIAEGQARRTSGEFLQFISQAEGSLAELDTQIVLSVELGFVRPERLEPLMRLIEEESKMPNALRLKIAARR